MMGEADASVLYEMLQRQIQDQQRELRDLQRRRKEEHGKLVSESQKVAWMQSHRQRVCSHFFSCPHLLLLFLCPVCLSLAD